MRRILLLTLLLTGVGPLFLVLRGAEIPPLLAHLGPHIQVCALRPGLPGGEICRDLVLE